MPNEKPPVFPGSPKPKVLSVPPYPRVPELPASPMPSDEASLEPFAPPVPGPSEPPPSLTPLDEASLEPFAPTVFKPPVASRALSAPQRPVTSPLPPSVERAASAPQPNQMPSPRALVKSATEAEIIATTQAVLEGNVRDYLKEKSPAVTPVSAPAVGSLVLSNEESFRKAIEYCAYKYDKVQDISWRIIGDHLIRDARAQSSASSYINENVARQADAWAYTGQFLNSCRAARIVVNLDDNFLPKDKEAIIGEISILANKVFNKQGEPQIYSARDLKNWNTEVAKIVYKHRMQIAKQKEGNDKLTDEQRKQYRIDDTAKDIMAALDCGGLEDNHYHLTTISQVQVGKKSVRLIETSQKLSGQTEQIREEIAKVASGAGNSVPWFNALAPFDQKIIQESCWKIKNAQGGHFKVIPTQFMEKMAGLRNAYLEARYTQRGSESPHKTVQSFRSSTPSFHGKNEAAKVQVTLSNNQYLQTLDPEGMCLNILFTPTPIAPIEQEASILLNQLSKDKECTIAETPTNIMRTLQGARDLSGYEKILNNIVTRLIYINIPPYIKAYIVGRESNLEGIKSFIIGLKSMHPAVMEAIINLVECRTLINTPRWWAKDVHYHLAARMAAAVHDAKRGILSDYMHNDEVFVYLYPISEIDAFCKSGKDRTGIEERVLGDLAFLRDIRAEEGIDIGKLVCNRTVNAGHQQALNGRNGGTPLCYGVKGELAPSMPEHYKGRGFARSTADTNKFPCTEITDKSVESPPVSPKASKVDSPKTSKVDSPKTSYAAEVHKPVARFHFTSPVAPGTSHTDAVKHKVAFEEELRRTLKARGKDPSGKEGGDGKGVTR